MIQRCSIVTLMLLTSMLRGQDMPLSQILIPGEDWKRVEGPFEPIRDIYAFAEDTNRNITVYAKNKIQGSIDENGKVSRFVLLTRGVHSRLTSILIESSIIGVTVNSDKRSLRISTRNKDRSVTLPVNEISVLAVTSDEGTLLVGDAGSKYVWWYRIGPDGQLSAGEKYSTLRLRKEETRSEVCGIDFDRSGRIYVAMKDGIQVFDPIGRLCGLILKPSNARPTAFCFGGPKGNLLYLACDNEVWMRKTNAVWWEIEKLNKK